MSKQAPLREWIPLAHDKNTWLSFIENYFESCRNTDYEDIPSSTNDEELKYFFYFSPHPVRTLVTYDATRRTLDTLKCIRITYLLTYFLFLLSRIMYQ